MEVNKVKKMLILSLCFVFLINGTALAEKNSVPEFPKSFDANHSVFEFFVLDLYYDEIMKYLKQEYGEDVKGYQLANDGNPNVSLRHTHGLKEEISEKFSFLVKIRLSPLKNSDLSDVKQLDIVNLYMAVNPDAAFIEKKKSAVELIKYKK